MQMPKPGPGHERMKALAGQWEGQETMHPSPWDPKGGVALGRRRSRMALSGFALIIDYEQEKDGAITFSGHGVMGFDPTREIYTLHWFDCMGSRPEVFEGRFDGDVLTLSHSGPGMQERTTYDVSHPERLVSKLELSSDGQSWSTLLDGVYERA